MLGKLKKASEAIGHVGNAWTFAGFVGWQKGIAAFGAGVLIWAATFFGSAVEGLSVTAVWVASLAAGVLAALLILIIAAIVMTLRGRPAGFARSTSKASGPSSAGIELASIGLEPPAGITIVDEITVQSLSIGFLNICNSDGKETLFRRSWTALCGGRQIERKFSHHRFYVALENKSVSKTLRNARLVIKAIAGPGGRILNDSFLSDSGIASVDILPGAAEYFLIGEGSDDSDAGMFHTRIVNSDEYDGIIAELDKRKHIGFALKTGKAGYPLLKNDGAKIHITAYADDASPVSGLLTINARTRIQIWLSEDSDV